MSSFENQFLVCDLHATNRLNHDLDGCVLLFGGCELERIVDFGLGNRRFTLTREAQSADQTSHRLEWLEWIGAFSISCDR